MVKFVVKIVEKLNICFWIVGKGYELNIYVYGKLRFFFSGRLVIFVGFFKCMWDLKVIIIEMFERWGYFFMWC